MMFFYCNVLYLKTMYCTDPFSIEIFNSLRFFVFSDAVPVLVYYSHIPAIIVSLLLSFFIWFNNRNALVARILATISILFSLWCLADLFIWVLIDSSWIMFLWSFWFTMLATISLLTFYFLYVFIRKKDVSFQWKLFGAIVLLPTILTSSTAVNLQFFDIYGCNAVESPVMINYTYTLCGIILLGVLAFSVKEYIKLKDFSQKRQVLFGGIGVLLFLLSFSGATYIASIINLISSTTDTFNIEQYGYFGMTIFIGFLTYLIVEYKAFSTKLLAAQALVGSLVILIGSQFLFIKNPTNRILNLITLLVSIIFGFLLVRSVKKEVNQREELQNLATKLADANTRLKDLDKLKTEFLSLASHQLRSPLTAIKGYASMLTEGSFGNMEEKQDVAVKRIYTSAQGLVNIVEDLLNVSKIEQGGMKYEFMTTELSKSVTDLYNEMKIPAESKGLAFTLDIPPYEKFIVNADPTKLKQVFLNLTDNSIKYTPAGFVKISLRHEGQNVVFAVSDNGVGISPETLSKLFEKFSRGEGGKLNTGGSGLGLYLAREIARAHKGDIVIESAGLGKGSTFKVILPSVASQTPGSVIAS